MKTLVLLTLSLVLDSLSFAGKAPTSPNDAATAFAKLKILAGKWEANTSHGRSHLTYEVISGGNAIVEHEKTEKMPEMLTVYYLDGNRLLLTHYCAAGNQPRMEAVFYAQTGELRFQFLDATNLSNPNAGHMHSATLHFVDNNHLSSEWQFFENGQPKFTESAQYTRIR